MPQPLLVSENRPYTKSSVSENLLAETRIAPVLTLGHPNGWIGVSETRTHLVGNLVNRGQWDSAGSWSTLTARIRTTSGASTRKTRPLSQTCLDLPMKTHIFFYAAS